MNVDRTLPSLFKNARGGGGGEPRRQQQQQFFSFIIPGGDGRPETQGPLIGHRRHDCRVCAALVSLSLSLSVFRVRVSLSFYQVFQPFLRLATTTASSSSSLCALRAHSFKELFPWRARGAKQIPRDSTQTPATTRCRENFHRRVAVVVCLSRLRRKKKLPVMALLGEKY